VDETATPFRVSSGTVRRWELETGKEPGKDSIGSLLKPTPPLRRYADVTRHRSLRPYPAVHAYLAGPGLITKRWPKSLSKASASRTPSFSAYSISPALTAKRCPAS
jgi:hypothetical protein